MLLLDQSNQISMQKHALESMSTLPAVSKQVCDAAGGTNIVHNACLHQHGQAAREKCQECAFGKTRICILVLSEASSCACTAIMSAYLPVFKQNVLAPQVDAHSATAGKPKVSHIPS